MEIWTTIEIITEFHPLNKHKNKKWVSASDILKWLFDNDFHSAHKILEEEIENGKI